MAERTLKQLLLLNVEIHKNHKVGMEDLRDVFADAVVFATGVVPKMPSIDGINHFSVMNYESAIKFSKSCLELITAWSFVSIHISFPIIYTLFIYLLN